MSIDRDYPPSKTQVRVLLVGLVILMAIGAALFGGFIPGLKPNYAPPATITVDGEPYYYTSVPLELPAILSNHTSPQSYTFHNLSFHLWVTNWYELSGGLVHGNATERNGSVYAFVLGQSSSPPVNASLFVSPDRLFAVSWTGGLLGLPWVMLMVRV
jgi:hypothetical protein